MIIGKNTETKENVEIDLLKLVSTRLLVQANSGGGKSWLLRRINEQTHGKIQQIVIDLEGEFSTLREQFDYLLVGKEGEIPANIQTAELLARKLLGLNVSTIIDLSEMKHHERITFVKRFLDSLINAPRELWHPVLVFVDEAHQFCPEKGQSESSSSVIDLETRGRKRGFCGVLATQRIAKLSKDAAAECNNVLVGRTVLDIDRKRAAEDLGFTTKEQERSLRDLDDGEFFVRGPAFSKKEVIKIKVGEIKTTHPEPGKNIIKTSETPANIKKLLKDVIDLPKEAEEELRTKNDFKKKIDDLNRELRSIKMTKTKPEADQNALQRAKEQGFREAERISSDNLKKAKLVSDNFKKGFQQVVTICNKMLQTDIPTFPVTNSQEIKSPIKNTFKSIPKVPEKYPESTPLDTNQEKEIGICARKIYSFLYNDPDRAFTKSQVGAMTGYSQKSGGFNNALYQLNAAGLINRTNGRIQVKEMRDDIAGEYDFTKTAILNRLAICPRNIYKFLLDNQDTEFSKEEIAEQTGYSAGSGGFNNAIYNLNTLGLIDRSNGTIKLNPELLEMR